MIMPGAAATDRRDEVDGEPGEPGLAAATTSMRTSFGPTALA